MKLQMMDYSLLLGVHDCEKAEQENLEHPERKFRVSLSIKRHQLIDPPVLFCPFCCFGWNDGHQELPDRAICWPPWPRTVTMKRTKTRADRLWASERAEARPLVLLRPIRPRCTTPNVIVSERAPIAPWPTLTPCSTRAKSYPNWTFMPFPATKVSVCCFCQNIRSIRLALTIRLCGRFQKISERK